MKRREADLLCVLMALPVVSLLLVAGCGGCTDSSSGPDDEGAAGNQADQQWQEELLNIAIGNLQRLEEFNSGQIAQQLGERLTKLRGGRPPADLMADPLLATWPEPEMLRQIVNRLNQWLGAQQAPPGWKPDPLVAALPEPLTELPQVKGLGQLELPRHDGFFLREAVWLRDVSSWARGENLDKVELAKSLFDWTVRNIQLEADTPGRIPLMPWETLLFGRGTATERAWVFVLLARQQRLDAAVLAWDASPSDPPSGDAEPSTESPAAPARLAHLVAVRAREDDKEELYLFDPGLGLPIPAPDGVKLGDSGVLDVRPATLSQVVADDGLLRRLDLEALGPYPVKSADLQQVIAAVEASPAALSVRMELIQLQLAADQELVLTARPTAQAERFRAIEHVADARLWTVPFETNRRRSQLDASQVRQQLIAILPFYAIPTTPLREGRLRYLKGTFDAPEGATGYFQSARPSDRELADLERTLAVQFYKSTRAALPQAPQWQIDRLVQQSVRLEMDVTHLLPKQCASYWLGLIALERQNYPSAIDYFARRTLAAFPDGLWTSGATYNLARTYEASGQAEKAVETYESDTVSPAGAGNLLRARWLKTLAGQTQDP